MPDINIGGHSVISRKEIPPYTIYERRPKPTGLTKYVVAGSPDGKMKDFGRYSTAIRWAKGQLPRTMPHVVVNLEDNSVIATVPIGFTLIDGPYIMAGDAVVDPAKVQLITEP